MNDYGTEPQLIAESLKGKNYSIEVLAKFLIKEQTGANLNDYAVTKSFANTDIAIAIFKSAPNANAEK